MKRLLSILLLLAAVCANAADSYIGFTLSITNVPVTSNTITINGNLRRWTNATTANTLQTNAVSINFAATNLFTALGGFPERGMLISWVDTNQIHFEGTNLSLTTASNWAAISSGSTQTLANSYAFMFPFDRLSATNRTNNASELIYATGKYSTNTFAEGSATLSNHVNRGAAQTLGNKTITNSVVYRTRLTNVFAINGSVYILTNGYYTNAILDNATLTNGVNYGDAFSSPGTNSLSEQFGLGALATGAGATALGNEALAIGDGSTALGGLSEADGYASIAVGNSAAAIATNSIALGSGSGSQSNNAIALGVNANAVHEDSMVFGTGATSSATNEITLGNASSSVRIPGRLKDSSQTNSIFLGTNLWNGDLSFKRFDNSSLANGNNAAILVGTNVNVNAYGPSAAYTLNGFQGGRDGKGFYFWKTNSLTMTVANDSGVDPASGNRIYTGTGADVTLTNNPGCVQFQYNSALQRWCIVSKSN